MPKPMTTDEMHRAKLIHGTGEQTSDTYRLHLESEVEGKPGKMIDVPGWMVGDLQMTELRMRAATVIRNRIRRGEEPRK